MQAYTSGERYVGSDLNLGSHKSLHNLHICKSLYNTMSLFFPLLFMCPPLYWIPMPPTAQGPVSYSLPHVYILLFPAGTFPSPFIYAKASLMFISKEETNKTLSPGQYSISLLPNRIAYISSFHFLLKSGSVLCPHLYHH